MSIPNVAARLLIVAVVLWPGSGAAQETAPADLPGLARSARRSLREGRPAGAAARFRRLTVANPDNGAWWLGLADSELRLGQSAAALDAIERGLALGSGSRPDRSYQVAQLFAMSGRPDSALRWLGLALAARYEHRPGIATDSTFVALRTDTVFRRLAGIPAAEPTSRDDGWRSDLRFLVEEAKRLSTGPTPVALTHSFDSAAAILHDAIPRLSDEAMYVELQRLVTMLGNGHSVLFPVSTPKLTLTMAPIDLYLFSDGLYVVGGTGDGASLVGREVERIGTVSALEALERVAPIVTRENPMGLMWNGPFFLTYPAILRALGIGTDPAAVHLVLRDAAGARSEVMLKGGEFHPPAKLMPPSGAVGQRPLYLRHPDDEYWLAPLPAASAIYVQYNQVANRKGVSIAQFADTILVAARRARAQNLIIDVRRNNGGSGHLNRPLIRALVQFEGWGSGHRVYVIVGRNTFSAAQNFINDVERMADAVFAGEPSSSRPNFVGEDTEVSLPWSGIVGSLSSRYFQDSDPLDERQWIAPEIPVRLSSSDYFGNRDPVLAAVLEAIRRDRRRP
ncbi:MAG: hypothetical protein ABI647_06955 [Gemmatimonadota bacterium]